MNIPKNVVHGLGALIVLAVVAAGIALVAVPVYLQSLATESQVMTAAGQNAAYQTQVDDLRTSQSQIGAITADVAALSAQIPAESRFDDVFEIVGKAAEGAHVTVVSVEAGDPVPYAARTAPTAPGAAPAQTGQTTDAGSTAADAAENPAPAAGTTDAGGASGAGQSGTGAPGRLQAAFTITVDTPDVASATRFLDALRDGPRGVAIIHSALTGSGDGLQLSVDALAFIRTKG